MPVSRWLIRPLTVRDHIFGYLVAMALFLAVIILITIATGVTGFVNLLVTLVGIFIISSHYLRPLVGLLEK